MKKLLLIFVMIAIWMFAGCETVRQIKAGCYGYWVQSGDGHKRGTRWSNKSSSRPYRQCVENNAPYKNTETRPHG
jgi:uncharacterized protein YxeA